ncbi:MAG TPA: hypothetical protein PLH64_08625 [Anaerolineaceae bacterium]|nr:hypothetical protein [Anaerolineaceae bacterium]
MEKEEIIRHLVEKQEYPEKTAEGAAQKIINAREDIKFAIEKFLVSNELTNIQVEEFDVENLVQDFKLHPVGAYLWLDWFTREPVLAKRFLQKGHSRPKLKNT